MTRIEVTTKTTAEWFAAAVDMRRLQFTAGRAWRDLPPGSHALQWFVRGAPGTTYTIKITRPAKIRFEHTATLDGDQRDAGVHWFVLEEER
jgi:hypothetical protein